jgi:hypothetical protein
LSAESSNSVTRHTPRVLPMTSTDSPTSTVDPKARYVRVLRAEGDR